jgi:predicted glycogen debranching enzyme
MPSGTTFVFGPHVLGSAAGFDHEWLVTDGVGGYAMGTVAGLRTRRYHALLVVPDRSEPPAGGLGDGLGGGLGGGLRGRNVALAALDPALTLPSGTTVQLGVHEWASGALAPLGHHHLERFDLVNGLPRWRWRLGEVVLERELAMLHGSTVLGVVHRLVAGPAVRLTLTALCTWRDAHGERDRSGPKPKVAAAAGGAVVERAYRLAGRGWKSGGEWYVDAFARREAERGLNPVEDLWVAGTFSVQLKKPGDVHEVSAWAGDLDRPPPPPSTVVALAHKRARRLLRAARARDEIDAALVLAADALIVANGRPAEPKKRKKQVPAPGGSTVVAGYPWFGSSLRDTMTAYEGLFLVTGRAKEGRALLLGHAAALEEAPPGDADGPLWFVHAVDRHVARTGDADLAAGLLPTVTRIIEWYAKGTGEGVAPDPDDGLLSIETDTTGLTWMNVRLNGRPATPRNGKPVELNALWVNALGAAVALHEAAGSEPAEYARLTGDREAVRAGFAKRFVAPEGWLYDLVDAGPAPYPLGGGGYHDDPVLRPNQLLAYSLPYAPLNADRRVLHAIGEHLLTPLGLRTLAPGEPGYRGAHRGGVYERDAAYHQGTVWPWLIGPFLDASRAAGLPLDGLLGGLEAQLGEVGLGSVSETADGDAPYRPTGSPFSARSVGELLRARSLAREAASQRP